MIGLFLGEKDLPNEIIKKIERKKIKYFIIDLTKNNKFKKNNINVHLKENQQIRLQQHKLEEQLLHLNLFLTSRKSKKLMKNFQSIDLRYKDKIAIKHF